jgi:hypothetical protein
MRSTVVRRVAYLTALVSACAVFVFSLAGIAGTQGQIKPDGRAADLAKQERLDRAPQCPWAGAHADKEV